MKIILYATPVILALVLFVPVFAVKNNDTGTQTGKQAQQQTITQVPQQLGITITPTGNQVQTRNRAETQNQTEGLQNRNQNAIENMSEVAKQVQLLQQTRTEGGIGQQVRQIAQEQNQAQNQIQEQLDKFESKNRWSRLLTGTDYGAVKNLRKELEQNQLRIEQLEILQNQLTNQEDITMVQNTIQAIIQENISLQERITTEEQTKSMFGWLFRLLVK